MQHPDLSTGKAHCKSASVKTGPGLLYECCIVDICDESVGDDSCARSNKANPLLMIYSALHLSKLLEQFGKVVM